MSTCNYRIIRSRRSYVLIQDIGPWDQYQTVTNGAESVVEELAEALFDRDLYYIDSEGQTDQLLIKDGKFAGFKAGGPPSDAPAITPHEPRDEHAFQNGFNKTNPDYKGD